MSSVSFSSLFPSSLSARTVEKTDKQPGTAFNTFAALLSEKSAMPVETNVPISSTSSTSSTSLDTSQGTQTLDIDNYFASPSAQPVSLADIPLLLPSAKNLAALSEHLSEILPGFLHENGIPSLPATITYDNEGNIQLPDDYPYAAELEAALEENPAIDKEMRTLNALASHYVEIQKAIAFQQEYAAAQTQAEINAVIAKYDYLLSDNRTYSTISLNFSDKGTVSVGCDGDILSLPA